METDEIKEVLIQRGYNKTDAELMARELVLIDSHLNEPLELWLELKEESEVEVKGISLKKLMQRNKLTYPAALLSVDWIYKEPDIALSVLKSV